MILIDESHSDFGEIIETRSGWNRMEPDLKRTLRDRIPACRRNLRTTQMEQDDTTDWGKVDFFTETNTCTRVSEIGNFAEQEKDKVVTPCSPHKARRTKTPQSHFVDMKARQSVSHNNKTTPPRSDVIKVKESMYEYLQVSIDSCQRRRLAEDAALGCYQDTLDKALATIKTYDMDPALRNDLLKMASAGMARAAQQLEILQN